MRTVEVRTRTMAAIVAIVLASSCVAQSVSQATDSIHPALTVPPNQAARIFEAGFRDAEKHKDADAIFGPVRKGIGGIKSRTVSWLTGLFPQCLIYRDGFQARRQYWPETEVAEIKESHSEMWERSPTLFFHGLLSILPNGRRKADPKDLDDVRVVLMVGDRVIQPLKQPGNLPRDDRMSVSTSLVPVTTNGRVRVGNETATFQNRYYATRVKLEEWFVGEFLVEFPLYDEAGKPLITTKDKEFSVVVVYGKSERRATYKLDELAKIGS